MRTNLISVVIPAHGRIATLSEAIASALTQRDVEVEVVVVDDGSPVPLAPALAADFPTVRVIRLLRRRGAAVARNAGIDIALGGHVAFLDSDDRFEPEKLARQRRALESSGARWTTCGFHTYDGRHWMTTPPRPGLLRRRNCLGGTSGLMADSLLLRAVRFDPRMLAVQDWELYLRLQAVAPGYHLTEPLYFYETRGSDRITRQARWRLLGHVQLYRRHIENDPDATSHERLSHRITQAMLAADAQGRRSCAIGLRLLAGMAAR